MAEFIEVMKNAERMCNSYNHCCECPSEEYCIAGRDNFYRRGEEWEKIVMKWVKDHPVKTNLDKLLEVFPEIDRNDLPSGGCFGLLCPDQRYCVGCKYLDFWDREYKESKGK